MRDTYIFKVLQHLSSERDQEEAKNTLGAIRCALFFGAPHQGMNIEYLEPFVEKHAHSSKLNTIRDLKADSEMLEILRNSLDRLIHQMEIITCIEQRVTTAPVHITHSILVSCYIWLTQLVYPWTASSKLPCSESASCPTTWCKRTYYKY
jgi:hypothetical protein